MKRNKFLITLCLILCTLGSLVNSYAATDASAHLDAYSASCSARRGAMISVTVDVDGTDVMDDIGAIRIRIYRSTDNEHFYHLRTFSYEDFPAMMDHNTDWYYETPITFLGIAGYYYYADVEVYAAKGGTSSTRTYMTNVVQAVN